jgi:hypothetical protein
MRIKIGEDETYKLALCIRNLEFRWTTLTVGAIAPREMGKNRVERVKWSWCAV